MTDALELEFTVNCTSEHAFEVWANRADMWWPRDHTRSGDPNTVVTFEPRPGGRVFERTPDGIEHEWGEAVSWEPPHRLEYLWHIYGERSEATHVEITFKEVGDETHVTVRHTGWADLAEKGAQLRERNKHGWANLIKAYVPAAND